MKIHYHREVQMLKSFYKRSFSQIIGVALILGMVSSCGEKYSKPVARVGGRIITVGDFEDSFARGKSKEIIAQSTMEEKLEHLNTMIDKELQIVAAYRMNLDKDQEIIDKVENRGESTILRRLIDKEVIDPQISESELKDFYERSKKDVKIEEIVLKTSSDPSETEQNQINKKLEEIQSEIKNGTDFTELVNKYSQDKDKRVSPQQVEKGLLKWTPYTADDPIYQTAFEMKKDEISEPIKTEKGYSIIKVVEYRNPVVRPYAAEKERIKQQLLRKRTKELEQKYYEFLEKLKQKYGVEYKDENIQKFVDVVTETLKDSPGEQKTKIPDPKRLFYNFTGEDKKLALVIYHEGQVTIDNFIEDLNKYPMGRMPSISSKEEVVDLIDRRSLPRILLKLEADDQNLRDDPEVNKEFKNLTESYILGKIKKVEVDDKINLTDELMNKYFEDHREEFKNEEKREVQEITVSDEKLAQEIYKRAKAGENFTKLFKKYNEKKTLELKEGNLGFITRGRQYYGKAAFEIGKGEVAEPILIGKNFSIIKVLNIQEATYKTFDQAKRYVNARLLREMKAEREKVWLEELRKATEITIYDSRLENTFSNYNAE